MKSKIVLDLGFVSQHHVTGLYSLQCSATCNGGFRTRSVRCLDEDEIIRIDCTMRPESSEFCNQIDCITGSEFNRISCLSFFLHLFVVIAFYEYFIDFLLSIQHYIV